MSSIFGVFYSKKICFKYLSYLLALSLVLYPLQNEALAQSLPYDENSSSSMPEQPYDPYQDSSPSSDPYNDSSSMDSLSDSSPLFSSDGSEEYEPDFYEPEENDPDYYDPDFYDDDTQKPAIVIINPTANETLSGSIPITIELSDDFGLNAVEIFFDGQLIETSSFAGNLSGNFSTYLNTENFLNGNYDLTVRATDTSDNEATAIVQVIIDNAIGDSLEPHVSFLIPLDFSNVKGSTLLRLSATDNIELKEVDIYVGNTLVHTEPVENTQAIFDYDLDTRAFNNGLNNVKAIVRDQSDNIYETSLDLTFNNPNTDLSNPTIIINTPTAIESHSGSIAVDLEVNDDIEIETVKVILGGLVIYQNNFSSPNEMISFPFDTHILSDKKHMLTVEAKDTYGNVTRESIELEINNYIPDTEKPIINIQSPTHLQTITSSANFTLDVSDNEGLEHVEVLFNGVRVLSKNYTAAEKTATISSSFNTASFPEGTRFFEVRATDINGNVKSERVSLKLDNGIPDILKPSVSFSAPMNNSFLSGTTLIKVNSSDDGQLNNLKLYVGGTLINTQTLSGPTSNFVYHLDTTDFSNGYNEITVTVTDDSGNAESQSLDVEIENYEPDYENPFFVINQPSTTTVSGFTPISITATDNKALDRAIFTLEGEILRTIDFDPVHGNIEIYFDTTVLEDISHNLEITVYDKQGNQTNQSIIFDVDNSAIDYQVPQITIITPNKYDSFKNDTQFKIAVENVTRISRANVYIDNILIHEDYVTNSYGDIIFNFDTTTLADDTYEIKVLIIDDESNQTELSSQFKIDNYLADTKQPELTILSPFPNDLISETLQFEATVSDEEGLNTIELQIDENTIFTDSLSGLEANINEILDVSNLPPGENNFKIIVTDINGNITEEILTIIIDEPIPDFLKPSVSFIVPTLLATINGSSALIQVDTSDNEALRDVKFYMNGILFDTKIISGTTYLADTTLNTLSYSNGTHSLKAVVSDVAGNTEETTVNIKIDNPDLEVPIVSFVNPIDGDIVSETINVEINYADNEGVATVELFINGASFDAKNVNALSGTASFPVDTRALGFNSLTLEAVVTDLTGNETRETIYVDAYNPDVEAPTFTFLEPADGSTVSETVTIQVDAHDNENIAEAVLTVNGFQMDAQYPNVKDGILTFTVETRDSFYFEEAMEITVTLFDQEYNEVSHTINVNVDNLDLTAPTLSVNSPYNDMTLEGSMEIDFHAEDNEALQSYSIKMNDSIVYSAPISSNSENVFFYFDTTPYANGNYDIQIVVTDASGNETESDTFGVIVDNPDVAAPTVTFVSPINGQNVSENFDVTIQANDNEIMTGAIFKIDGIQVDSKTLSSSNETIIFPVTSRDFNNGMHTFSVTVTDESGNPTTKSIQLNINNPDIMAPTLNITSHTNNATVSELVNIAFSANDDRDLSSAELFINNTLVSTQALTGNSGSFLFTAFNSRDYDNGSINVKVIIKDSTGNETESSITLNIDNSDIEVPIVSFVNPIDGDIVSETINVEINYADNEGVATVELFINGASFDAKNINALSGTASFPVDTRALGFNSLTLEAVVTDLTGNETRETIYVDAYNPDVTAPTFTFLEPADGSTVSETVTIRVDAHDNENIAEAVLTVNGFQMDAQYPNVKDGILTFTVETRDSFYFEEAMEITVTLRDDQYNEVSNTIYVNVDNPDLTAPTLSVNSPYNDMTLEGSMEIDFHAEDNEALQSYSIKMNGEIVYSDPISSNSENVFFYFDTTPYANGNYDIQIVVTDASGNETESDTFGVIVDNPDVAAPTVTFVSPINGQNVSENFDVTIQANDNEIMTGAIFKIDGIQVDSKTLSSSNETIIFPVTSRDFNNGMHTFSVTVTDESGNPTTKSIQLNINNPDIMAPTLNITSHTNNATVSELVNIAFSANDDRDLSSAELFINNTLVSTQALTGNSGSFQFDGFNSRDYDNGSIVVKVIIKDSTGNETESEITLNINNPDIIAPTLNITSHTNNATVSELVNIAFSANDDRDLSSAELFINNTLVSTQALTGNSGNFQFDSFNSRDYDNGSIAVKVIIKDSTGNETESEINLNINNPDIIAPTLNITSHTNNATITELVNIAFNANDDRDLSSAELFINNTLVSTQALTGNSGNFQFDSFNSRDYDNGSINVKVIIKDSTGNETESEINLNINNPDIEVPLVSFVNPTDGDIVSETINVEINYADNEGVATVELFINGASFDAKNVNALSGTASFPIDTRALGFNSLTLEAVVTDLTGNETRETIYVDAYNPDVEAPTFTFLEPADGSTVSETVTIQVDAHDNENIAEAVLTVNGFQMDAQYPNVKDGILTFTVETRDSFYFEEAMEITVTLFDQEYNEVSHTINVNVDNPDLTAPTLSVNSPYNDMTLEGSMEIDFHAEDNEALQSYSIKMNDSIVYSAPISSNSENVFFYFDTTPYANGNYDIQIVVTDASGNETESDTFGVIVDNPDVAAPTVTFISPTNGQNVSENFDVTIQASDNENLTSAIFKIDGIQVDSKALSSSSETLVFPVTSRNFNNGMHTFSVTVTDESGNPTTKSIQLNINNPDIVAPTLNITSHTNNATVSELVNIAFSANDDRDLSSAELFINNTLVSTQALTGNSGSFLFTAFNSRDYDNGSINVKVIIKDSTGNETESSITLNIDNSDIEVPLVSFVNPTDGDIVSETINVEINYADNEGVATVELFINGASFDAKNVNALSGTASFPVDTRALGFNSLTLEAVVTDLTGNETRETIYVDAYNPDVEAPTFTFLEPADGSTVSETVTIRVDAHDNENIAEAVLTVNGFELDNQSPNFKDGILTFTVETRDSFYFEEAMEITVTLRDDQYNEVSNTIYVNVDNPDLTAPTLSVNSPYNDMTLEGSMEIDFHAEDNEALQSYSIKMNGEIVYSDPISSNSENVFFYFDTTPYANGNYDIQIVVTDASGNETESDTFEVIVDNPDVAAPTVTFISPTNGQNVSENFDVTIQASDNENLTSAIFKIDGIQVDSKALSSSSETLVFPVTSRNFNNGMHTFSVTVTDESGNPTTKSIQLNINNPDIVAPTLNITSHTNNATVSELVNIAFSANDDRDLSSAELFINNTLVSTQALTGNSGSFLFTAFNSRDYDNGSINVKVIIKDSTGNETESSITLNIDNSDIEVPLVSFVNPTDGDIVSETINVEINYADNEGVATVELFINGASFDAKNVNALSGTASFPVDTRALGFNSLTLEAVVTDLTGNETRETIYVDAYNPDVEAPTFTFLEPADGSTVSETVTIRVDAHDNENIAEAVLTVNGFELDNQSPNFKDGILTFTVETRDSFYFEEAMEITVTLRDDQYNEVSNTIYVNVDNPDLTAPTLSVNSPYNDMTLEGSMEIDFHAEDNEALQSYSIKMNGEIVYSDPISSNSENVFFYFDTTPYANGNYDIQIVVTDASGNETESDTFEVIVDNPDVAAPTVTFISPTNGQNVSENFDVTIQASDNENLTSAIFKIDGIQVDSKALSSSSETLVFPVTSRNFNNGMHTFSVTVTDESGNPTTKSIQLNINNPDIVAPTLNITSHTNNATITELVNIAFNANDDRDLSSAELFINNTLVSTQALTGNSGSFLFTAFNSRDYDNGSIVVKVIIKDSTGNETESEITLNINNPDIIAPTLNITSHTNNATVSELVNIAFSANDDRDLSSAELFINNTLVSTQALTGNSGNFQFDSFNSRDYDNGSIAVKVIIKDSTGNETESEITLNINNPDIVAPTLNITSHTNNATITELVNIAFNANDDRDLSSAELFINNTLVSTQALTGNAGNFQFDGFNSRDYDNGSISVKVIIKDSTGNETESEITLNINNPDIVAPTLNITSHTNNATITELVNIAFNANDDRDLSSAELFINNTLVSTQALTGNSGSFQFDGFNSRDYDNGSIAVKVIIKDSTGNETESEITLNINNPDIIAPTLNITSHTNNATITELVNIAFSANDDRDLSSAELFINNTLVSTQALTGNSGNFQFNSFNSRDYDNGSISVKVIIKDSTGNETESQITLNIDNPDIQAPVITFISPLVNSTNKGLLEIDIDLLDNDSLKNMQVYVGGRLVKLQRYHRNHERVTFSVDIKTFQNGDYPIKVIINDDSGNQAEKSMNITIQNFVPDTIKPELQVTSHVDGQMISGNAQVGFLLTDNQELKSAKFYFGGRLLTEEELTGINNNFTLNIDTTRYFNGPYTLEAIVFDERGNRESKKIKLNINN